MSWKNTLRKNDELEEENKYREIVEEMWKKSNMPVNEGVFYEDMIEDFTNYIAYEFRYMKFDDIPESFLNEVKEEIQEDIDELKRKGPSETYAR